VSGVKALTGGVELGLLLPVVLPPDDE